METKQGNPRQSQPWEDPLLVMFASWIIAFALMMLMLVVSAWNDDGSAAKWTTFDSVITTIALVIGVVGTIMSFVMAPTAPKPGAKP